MISRIKKRNGRIQAFNKDRIANALGKAFRSVNQYSESTVESLTNQVVSDLNAKYRSRIPSVEDIQDIVEDCLIKNGFDRAAKAYILYRNERARIRDSKKLVGVVDDLDWD